MCFGKHIMLNILSTLSIYLSCIMPIFHELKVIHVHNPRCGGTTINNAILKGLGLPASTFRPKLVSYHYLYGNHRTSNNFYELDHLCFAWIREATPKWLLDDYKSFVVVRHPWERFVSEYTRKVSTNCKRFINPQDISFETYCLKFIQKAKRKYLDSDPYQFQGVSHFNGCHFLPQYLYAGLECNVDITKPQIIDIKEINQKLPPIFGNLSDKIAGELMKPRNSHKQKISEDIKYQIEGINPDIRKEIEDFYHLDFQLLEYEKT